MKKIFALLLSLLFLAGCSRTGESLSSKPPEPDASSAPGETIDCRISCRMEDSLLLLPQEDQQGQAMQPDALRPGMCVQIDFDGSVLETYPCQLSGATALRVTGEFQNLVPFYLDRLDELYQEDEALNSDIEKVALDLSELGNISEEEKEALRYLVECRWGKEAFFSSYQELCDQGEIDRDRPYYEKGIILSLACKEETQDGFAVSGEKWRSGLGAIGYHDAKVQWKDGEWTFEKGAWFIS